MSVTPTVAFPVPGAATITAVEHDLDHVNVAVNVIGIAPVIVAALGTGNDAVTVTDAVIDLRIAYA